MVKFIVGLLNLLIKALGGIISFILGILPNSPFQKIDFSAVQEHLGGLAWILPISSVVTIFTAWLSCIIIYYIYQVVLRWIKMIK